MKKISHDKVSLALVYLTSFTLYEAPLDDEFCTSLLAFTVLHFGKMQNFDSYGTELQKWFLLYSKK